MYTLESIQTNYPAAFSELARMDIEQRATLLVLLNGKTTSPLGRGYAEYEIDKEDAVISSLKIKYGVEITTKRARGNYSYHLMTTKQIDEYFNDREAMRKRVEKDVWSMRTRKFDKQLRNGINWRGLDWVKKRCDVLTDFINEEPANDSDFKKKKGSE